MSYGRVYIDNLRKKVTVLFDELKKENKLCESAFIELFKKNHPKDYAMLQYEWEFKVHEFKKNRKGNPKPLPIRPDKILSNMYRNYYFKLVKSQIIREQKNNDLNRIRCEAGKTGLKITYDNDRYTIIDKKSKEILHDNLTFKELKERLYPNKDKTQRLSDKT